MGKFICVFSETDRDAMVARGLMLLKSDERNHMYVFENDSVKLVEKFALDELECVYTDTLTF